MTAVVRGHYRSGSTRGPGVRIRRKRQEVGRWLFTIAGAFPAGSSAVKVASALAALIGEDGRLDPTVQWIAGKVGLCTKTVARMLSALRKRGFVTWQRRIAVTKEGVEQQTSNAYQLQFPEPVDPAVSSPAGLSTPPPSSLSVDRKESILSEQVLSDTPPPAPVEQRRPLPYRVIQQAKKVLADRVRAVNEAWAAGAEARAAARKQAWRESRGSGPG